MKTRRVKTRGKRATKGDADNRQSVVHVPLGAVRNTIDAIKKRLKSLHRGTGGKAVNGRCFRAVTLPHSQTQTPNFTATQSRCGSRLQDGEVVPNGATLRRVSGSKRMLVRSYSAAWTASSAQMGQEKRVRTATKESGEAVSEGNVAENMTVPRKADRANRLDYKATAAIMCDCTATATLSALQSQQQERCRRKAALNTKKAVYSSRTDG
jgi:hypothetical protein